MNGPETPPLSAREIWRDVVDGLFSTERGLPYTFATLWWKPARQARGYVETRDPRLLRPLRYLLLAVAFYSTVTWWMFQRFGHRLGNALDATAMLQIEAMLQHAGWLVLLVLPLVALLLHLASWRRTPLLSALVLLAYAQAQVLFGQALVAVPAMLLWHPLAGQACGLLLSVYMLLTVGRFVGGGWLRATWVAVVTVAGGTLINVGVVTLLLPLLVDLGG